MNQSEENWIEWELATLNLNDKRLDKRAKTLVMDMSAKPTASIPGFSENLASTKAAYDFFKNEKVESAKILSSQREATIKRMRAYPLVLGLQDTTEINLTHFPSTEGTGVLSSIYSQGFLAHSTLVVTPEGLPLGLLAQENWAREEEKLGQCEKRRQLPIEEKESYKWLKGLTESSNDLPPDTRMLMVSDRESDVMEYFLHPRPPQVELLLRSGQDRRIEQSDFLLWQNVGRGRAQGLLEIEIGAKDGNPARTAHCEIRYQRVTVKPPKNRPGYLPKLKSVGLWAILLKEVGAPDNVDPIEWRLLTTISISSFEDACLMVQYYARRWIIERFHFVLKSGCQVERRRLATVPAIERFLALANIVAWRLLYLTYSGRISPELSCTVALQDAEWKALYCFIHKTHTPSAEPPSLQQAIRWIAQLGGFLGRKGDGHPGVKTLWKGWQRLADILHTWLIFNPQPT